MLLMIIYQARHRTLHHLARLPEESQVLAFALQALPVELRQVRFVIEGVEVTDASAAEDLDHAFGFGRKVGRAGGSDRGLGASPVALEQPGHRDGAQPAGGVPKKLTTRESDRVT